MVENMKNLYYVRTNGYDMVVSANEDKEVRYLTETGDFPVMNGLDDEDQVVNAKEFLESIEDDSTWESAGIVEDLDEWLNLDGHLGDASEIIVNIEKEL